MKQERIHYTLEYRITQIQSLLYCISGSKQCLRRKYILEIWLMYNIMVIFKVI